MSPLSARLSLGFACVGHTYSHLFQPIFYVTVLSLERELGLSHGEVVVLIIAGNLLFGFAAPLAGWLGDRWSSIGMMAIFFLGTGAGMVMTGLASTPFGIALGLAVTGLLASIYHPVGIAWLVRNSIKTGTALGINGLFGGLGPALAAVMTGALIDFSDWRAAFVIPGFVVAATGIAFTFIIARGWIVESKVDRKPALPPSSRRDVIRVFVILSITMLCGGIIYHAVQPALPKAFADSFQAMAGDGMFGISVLVSLVYLVSGLMQVVGGHLADRFPVKRVYLICYILQVPLLAVAAGLGGPALVAIAVIMVSSNTSSLPAENILIARYAPNQWRALVYGIKFFVAIGFASLGVILESAIYDMMGDFYWLFTILAAIAALAVAAILLLPEETREAAPAAAE